MGSLTAIIQSLRGAFVSTVNWKFLRFKFAFTLAAIVGVLTLLGVGAITYKLVTTCSLQCRSIPLALVATETLSELSCVGFKSQALQLSVSPNEQSRQLFHDVLNTTGMPNTIWTTFMWTTSKTTLGKCSYLHATQCGLQEWLSTFQGLAAIASIGANKSTLATAAWPDKTTLYAYNGSLDQQTDNIMTAATGTARLNAAAVQQIITAGGGAALIPNATILEAPATAACCDVTTSDTKLGIFGGGSSRFVVNIKGHRGLSMSMTSCGTNSTSKRCSWVELSTAMVMPPSNQINQDLCSKYYQQATDSFSVVVGMSASICQMLGEVTSGNAGAPPSAPYQLCLNGTMNNVWVPLSNYYTITGSCPTPGNPVANATATLKPWPVQQLAATQELLPLAHEFGMAITAYMASAQVDIESAAQGLNAIKNDNEAASWWMENYLYCCSESCNDWLSSIGSAMGYEAYIEGGVALLVILAYLAFFEPERRRLGLTNLKGIADIAFEVQAVPAAAAEPAAAGTGGSHSPESGAEGSAEKGSQAAQKLQAGSGSNKRIKGSEAGGSDGISREEAQLPGSTATVEVTAWPDHY